MTRASLKQDLYFFGPGCSSFLFSCPKLKFCGIGGKNIGEHKVLSHPTIPSPVPIGQLGIPAASPILFSLAGWLQAALQRSSLTLAAQRAKTLTSLLTWLHSTYKLRCEFLFALKHVVIIYQIPSIKKGKRLAKVVEVLVNTWRIGVAWGTQYI